MQLAEYSHKKQSQNILLSMPRGWILFCFNTVQTIGWNIKRRMGSLTNQQEQEGAVCRQAASVVRLQKILCSWIPDSQRLLTSALSVERSPMTEKPSSSIRALTEANVSPFWTFISPLHQPRPLLPSASKWATKKSLMLFIFTYFHLLLDISLFSLHAPAFEGWARNIANERRGMSE